MEKRERSSCRAQVGARNGCDAKLILRGWRCDARCMMSKTRIFAGLMVGLSCCAMRAQEQGNWRPMSTTARSILGPIAIGDEKLVINFVRFPIAEIRSLTPAELAAVLPGDTTESGRALTGHLFRLSIPADQRFLHKNTLCGGDETQWMATSVQGKTLQLAFFSGATMPVMTAEAMANATNVCGTYTYVRG